MSPAKINLKIYQGSTFTQVFRWESSTKVYIPIVKITNSAPIVITAPGHNINLGWRAKLTNVSGMKEANSLGYQIVTDIDGDNVIFNQINSIAFSPYTAGGILEYNKPVPIAYLKARMQLRKSIDSSVIIHELTTENNGVIFDTINNTITITIPDEVTAAFNFATAVYNLEFENTMTGETTSFIKGMVTLDREVSR